MPPPYTRHVFTCNNRRPDGSPRGCCATKGGDEVRLALKKALDAHGVTGVRANAAGCLDACELGVAMVVYPEGVWYSGVTTADVNEIVEAHLIGGRPVERLVMKLPIDRKKEPKGG
jgi:(2Fe-2S) ferredoxin